MQQSWPWETSNNLKFKLPSYEQVVTKHTRKDKVLDKCYTNTKHAYPVCNQLGNLGQSDYPTTTSLQTPSKL